MNPLTTEEQAELEAAYQQAQMGSESPSMMTMYCDQCGVTFTLTPGHADVCEHIKELLSK